MSTHLRSLADVLRTLCSLAKPLSSWRANAVSLGNAKVFKYIFSLHLIFFPLQCPFKGSLLMY